MIWQALGSLGMILLQYVYVPTQSLFLILAWIFVDMLCEGCSKLNCVIRNDGYFLLMCEV